MATLNVKNLPDALYRKLRARAKRHRRSIAQEVTHILANTLHESELHAITELQGLGKEHWKGINATQHVELERRAWD